MYDGDESGSEGEDDVLVAADTNGSHKADEAGSSRTNPVVIVDAGFSTTTLSPEESPANTKSPAAQVGAALKRNADGSVIAPKITKRKSKGSKVLIHGVFAMICTNKSC